MMLMEGCVAEKSIKILLKRRPTVAEKDFERSPALVSAFGTYTENHLQPRIGRFDGIPS